MLDEQGEITAKEAIASAFRHFGEFFENAPIDHVLLEEVERVEEGWCVVIGFDAGRRRTPSGSALFSNPLSEPVREYRKLFLNAEDGSLIKMK